MSRRTSLTGFVALLMIITAVSPLAVQATPSEESEYYYGVEYDWSSLDSDLRNVTGLDIQELLTEIMQDADDAGFNLDIGQLTTGSSNVYVHQTEDISPQTIQDADGNDVDVWSRSSDVVLRHGLLSNAVIMTDWSETTFGSQPTGFDISVQATAENVLTVDVLYTEYLNDAYELVGSDIALDMMISNDADLEIDISAEGDGEELLIDFNTGIDFSYSIDTDAIWRLGQASPIYTEAAQNQETVWSCDEYDVGVYDDEWGGGSEVIDDCGDIEGTYSGSADYNVFINGIPTEEFGFDAGEFDISLSDVFSQTGDYSDSMNIDTMEFSMSDEVFEVDLGDGEVVNAVACQSCPPGNPVMFVMIGNAIAYSSESFGEAVAEDFEAEIEDSLGEIFGDIFGGGEEGDYDDSSNMWMCDNGEMIPEWYVNDGEEDCSDGSDEMDFFVRGSVMYDYSSEMDVYGISGTVESSDLGYTPSPTIECQNYWGDYEELEISSVNDGWDDCEDGADEYDSGSSSIYYCYDGSMISLELVNDGTYDCADGSDEPVDNEGDWFSCDDGTNIPMQWVNDGTMNCPDSSDEYDASNPSTFYCDEWSTSISLELVRDGNLDCADGTDEGSVNYYMMDVNLADENGNLLFDEDDLMLCATWRCDIGIDVQSGNFGYMSDTEATTQYGDNTMCASASLDGDQYMESPTLCGSEYVGPEIREWESGISEGGDEVHVYGWAGHWSDTYDDATLGVTINKDVDGQTTLIHQEDIPFNGASEIDYDYFFTPSGEGDYCVEFVLIQDGSTSPFNSYDECITIEEGPEPSDKLMTIAEAFAESSLENVFEAFGNNIEETFEELEEQEVQEIPYTDGMWAPLWSNEHATIVGVSVYAWDEQENGYVIAGPSTEGYSNYPPLVFASINYITGVPAQEAQEIMAETDSIEEIVDTESHDLSILEEALEDAGADTGDLEFDLEQETGNEGTNEGEQSAEEVADSDGLLPFISPIYVLAMLAIAAFVIPRSKQED